MKKSKYKVILIVNQIMNWKMLDLKVNNKLNLQLQITNNTKCLKLYIEHYILKIIKIANNKLESITYRLQSITYITNYKW